VEHHVKLLGGHLRTGGRGGDGTTLLRHDSGVFVGGISKGEVAINGKGRGRWTSSRTKHREEVKSGENSKREEIDTYIFCHMSSGEVEG
jgi:hypothetical protein